MDNRGKPDSRLHIVSLLAAAAPLVLVGCLGIALGSSSTLVEKDAIGLLRGLVFGLLSGLGPLAIAAVNNVSPLLASAISLVLWTIWLCLVALTRIGNGRWSRYFLGGLLWCVVGIITVFVAAIQN